MLGAHHLGREVFVISEKIARAHLEDSLHCILDLLLISAVALSSVLSKQNAFCQRNDTTLGFVCVWNSYGTTRSLDRDLPAVE